MKNNFFGYIIESRVERVVDKVIVVTHLVPGSEEFILEVNEKLPIAAVIPKPNSIDAKVKDIVGRNIPLLEYSREKIKSNAKMFVRDIHGLIGDSTFAIIDTGGYFSHVLYELHAVFGNKLIGIVEDTENGHQKYEAILNSIDGRGVFPYPVISVARSALKDPEDFLVGQAIVFSAEATLREQRKILNGIRVLVFGYGKIGRSIAHHLRLKSAQVSICDTNPSRHALALAHGFNAGKKECLLGESELIFCATGNLSLKQGDLNFIKENAYIFTATSADDEIEGHAFIIGNGKRRADGKLSKVDVTGKNLFICNNGNSANFMHGGVVGPFIKLVQAELVFALSQLEKVPRDRVAQLKDNSKHFIADTWLAHFAQQ